MTSTQAPLPLALLALIVLWWQSPAITTSATARAAVPPLLRPLHLHEPPPPMVRLSSSLFSMGSTADEVLLAFATCGQEPQGQRCRLEAFSHERPVREVALKAFWLDRFEVSVGDYDNCVRLGYCRPVPRRGRARRFSQTGLPMTLVRWRDARDYCKFRGARLPTEAEFERAAAGRNRRTYPWGTHYDSRLSNHGRLASDRTSDADGFRELAPVVSFDEGATPLGIHNLAGNASEWVFDRYADTYDPKDLRNPLGPPASTASVFRVVRGGSFTTPRPWMRTRAREFASPNQRSLDRGFRCAQ